MSILVYVSDLMQQLGDFIPFFSFTVAATSAIYTLSLHDALPICYTQRLPVLYGRSTYRFPAGHTLAVVDQWSFRAVVKDGARLSAMSPSHPGMKLAVQGQDLVATNEAKNDKIDRDVVLELADHQAQ